jgi:hypothetical protein
LKSMDSCINFQWRRETRLAQFFVHLFLIIEHPCEIISYKTKRKGMEERRTR